VALARNSRSLDCVLELAMLVPALARDDNFVV